jgi:hypothetical protein
MKLKKALEIVNYYACQMKKEEFIQLAEIDDTELEELQEACNDVSDFLRQFK